MHVCSQGGPKAQAWPHGPWWFLLQVRLDTMPTASFLALGKEEFRFQHQVQPCAVTRDKF